MKKGFSINISPSGLEIDSFIAKEYDSFYLQNPRFEFLFEGVLLNKKKLLKEFALKDFETLIQELYVVKKEHIINLFEGEFRGFIFDKIHNKLYVFTNITSTQAVFYTQFEDRICMDTSLVRLSETLRKAEIQFQPDLESIYQLLCFTNLPEDKTPLQNVKKLLDGNYLEIDCASLCLTEKMYFDIAATPVFSGEKNAAIDQIHDIFTDSVLMEYEKDIELGTNHLALLSGGLDSRVAMMYAFKNGQKPGNAFCFSHSGYFDHTISEKIATDYDIHYEFIPLNGGKFLNKIDQLTEISEGMVFYTGGIHVQHAVENLHYQNFALFHSGQIGDGVLGGFNSEAKRKKPTYYKIVDNEKFFPKVQDSLDKILKKYETEEHFMLRNVAYNRTGLGADVFQQLRYQTSPFMTRDFLKLAISLPESWKFNHRFYIEWINRHCQEATNYRWERTLMKPDAKWKTSFGDKLMKRSFNILNTKILKTPQNCSMYPYQYYFDSDVEIQHFYQKYFDDNIHRLENYPELSQDVFSLFASDSFSLKSKAVNILSIFKLYF